MCQRGQLRPPALGLRRTAARYNPVGSGFRSLADTVPANHNSPQDDPEIPGTRSPLGVKPVIFLEATRAVARVSCGES